MDKYIGKRLEGRYELQALIGSGGMANVYKAYDIIDERTVAVKILRDEYLDNAEFLRRFKNESKAIAVLSHPNIVRVFDVSFTGKIHSIVMEYIDGITLKDYIERQGPLGWKEAIHFTMEILKALQHAHDKGIVHRDIKPQNIMLLQSGTIKVTDFGIARFARSEVQTITDRAIGSVHYISPEQALGSATDEKSDLYSVGVMMFEMVTGTLPFEADSPVSVAIKQVEAIAVRPSSINSAVPIGLEDIIMRAMEKNANNRYRSAGEMMTDIERFKQDPTINFAYKYLDSDNNASKEKKYRRAISQTREDTMETKSKRTPYIPILTGVTFAFVLASLGFIGLMVYLNNPFQSVDEVKVPELIGTKFDTAIISHNNIEIVLEEELPNDEYGKGVIYDQTPRAGRVVREGGTVTVKVSAGQLIVTMPNFAGRDANEVYARIRELGLEVQEKPTYSADVPEKSVIYTDPSVDAQVSAGTLVTVYVSMGPEERLVNVQDVVGMHIDDVKSYLESNYLLLGETNYEDGGDVPEGVVMAQDPPPGTLQPEETPINLVVSKGAGSTSGGGGDSADLKQLSIAVRMPRINRVVTLQAKQDGRVVAEEILNPSDIEAWKPSFEGTSRKSEIRIYIDNKLYIEYELDFATKQYMATDDRSGSFE